MKILNIFFIVLFVSSAALQYNDPDPYVWMPIYLYGAFICYLSLKGKYNLLLYIPALTVYISYMSFLFIDTTGVLSWWTDHDAENLVQSMKATKPWIEETREFFGLAILTGAILTNMIWFTRLQNKSVPSIEPLNVPNSL